MTKKERWVSGLKRLESYFYKHSVENTDLFWATMPSRSSTQGRLFSFQRL